MTLVSVVAMLFAACASVPPAQPTDRSLAARCARAYDALDASAPGRVRTQLREDGVWVTSRERRDRITDAEIKTILCWIDLISEKPQQAHLVSL